MRTAPTRLAPEVFGGAQVVMVSCGSRHTLVLTEDGDVWSFGCGGWGRLGLGDVADRMVPSRLASGFGGSKVAFVAAGASHSLAITVEGDVWSWGCGRHGCLGLNVEDRLEPASLGREKFGGAQIIMVAAGLSHTVAVCTGGMLWCADAHARARARARACAHAHTMECHACKVAQRVKLQVRAEAAPHHACRGCGRAWGNGEYGKLGLGDTTKRTSPASLGAGALGGLKALQAACGDDHTLAVTEEGGLWSWGAGTYGRLGLGDERHQCLPVRVGSHHFSGQRISMVAAGDAHSVALTELGALYTWGMGRLEARHVSSLHDPDDSDFEEASDEGGEDSDESEDARIPSGLGHADLQHKLVPTHVDPQHVAHARLGRCRNLPPAHALAFAMATHPRLGQDSVFAEMLGDLVLRVCESGQTWPRAPVNLPSFSPGLVRLLGGSLVGR